MEQNKPATTERRSSYSRERYEKNKDEILKNRREKYRKQTNKELAFKPLKNLIDN